MKIILSALFLVLISLPASAQVSLKTDVVTAIVPNKITCSSMTLPTTAQELTGNTTVLSFSQPGVYELDILTLSSSATNYFSDNSAVATSGNLIGYPVYPLAVSATSGQPQFVPFVINPTQKFYGVSGTAGQSVMICKKR